MSEIYQQREESSQGESPLGGPTDRRTFLRWSGVSAAALVVVGCEQRTRTIVEVQPPDTIEVTPPAPTFPAVTLDFSNDFGVLNYAFALEQLEAAFYTRATADAAFNATFPDAGERQVMIDLRDHEVVHRDFLAAAIPALGGTAIPGLTPNFDSINFADRTSVLTAAQTFEDLGVGAYNGAGQFLQNPTLLGIAGKIVSVEARHASAIRDLLRPRSRDFAPRAFDDALPPQQVLSSAAPFIRNQVTLTNVPAFTASRVPA
ncbi:hypothetical protein BH23GEM3_BH23GEM3_23370 [soil metagenome]|jgi:hypothetical protein